MAKHATLWSKFTQRGLQFRTPSSGGGVEVLDPSTNQWLVTVYRSEKAMSLQAATLTEVTCLTKNGQKSIKFTA